MDVRLNLRIELLKSYRKPKLDKELSFSIGTQAISEQLAGSEYFQKIEVHFSGKTGSLIGHFTPGWSLRKLKGKSNDLLRFRCFISCNFSAPLDRWSIRVYPNKREEGAFFKDFTFNIAIPVIKKWLAEPKSETWFEGHRYLQIGLNEERTEYCKLETFNDSIVNKQTSPINVVSQQKERA